jgi:tetratricopeptide (TPR) repeat protein
MAQPGTRERIYADLYQGLLRIGIGAPVEAHVYLRRAIDAALALNDNSAVFAAAGWVFLRLHALRDRRFQEQLARDMLTRPRAGVRTNDLGICLFAAGLVLLGCGQRDDAESLWRDLAELAQHTRDTTLLTWAEARPAQLAYFDGRLEEALALTERVRATAAERGVGLYWVDLGRLAFHLGRGSEEAVRKYEAESRPQLARNALLFALLGLHDEAHAIRGRFIGIEAEDDESSGSILLPLLEASILGGDRDTASALAKRFAPFADCTAPFASVGFTGSIARILGDAAALLDDPATARTYYTQALEVCAKVRFRPEIAITRLHLAELLLQHYPAEADEARGHLDFAIDEFRDMKMQPYLERALRHKGLLHA